MLYVSYPARRLGVLPVLALLCWGVLLTGCESPDRSPPPPAARRIDTAHTGPEASRPDSSALSDDAAAARDETVVMVIGNSLAAGHGLRRGQAFPALVEQKAQAANLNVNVINAGNSGDTTADGLRRLDWLLRRPVDVLVLELGGNDALRGLPVDSARANLQHMIGRARARYPDVRIVLAGMKAPPNLGNEYTRRFEQIYPTLAQENGVHLIPFLLKGVAGRPALNQPDGIHPTARGQRLVAQNVWEVLGPLLKSIQEKQPA